MSITDPPWGKERGDPWLPPYSPDGNLMTGRIEGIPCERVWWQRFQAVDRFHRPGSHPVPVIEADYADIERRIMAHYGQVDPELVNGAGWLMMTDEQRAALKHGCNDSGQRLWSPSEQMTGDQKHDGRKDGQGTATGNPQTEAGEEAGETS